MMPSPGSINWNGGIHSSCYIQIAAQPESLSHYLMLCAESAVHNFESFFKAIHLDSLMLNVFSQENLQLRGQGPSNHPEKSWRLRVWQQIQPRGRFRGRTVSS